MALGDQVHLVETGDRRVFDFAHGGVYLEVVAGAGALEGKLYLRPGVQAYVWREGGRPMPIGSPASGRGVYQSYEVGSGEESLLVEVGGVRYRVTLENNDGDYFAEVQLAD